MPLIALKCPQCGADLEIDSDREFMYCEYCGTKVLRDKHTTINNSYTKNVTNNVTYADGHEVHTADWYYNTWQGLLKRGRYNEGERLFEEFRREYPLDYRVENELRERRRENKRDIRRMWRNFFIILAVGIVIFILFMIYASSLYK